jgi:hypothetical protein
VEHAVLVGVRQALEDHEPVVVGTVNPVVGLQSLHRCHEVWSNALQLSKVVPELSTASVDREVSIASKAGTQVASVENRELEGELVEGRRGVVEAVTDDRSPLRSRVPHTIDPVDVLSASTFYAVPEAVSVAAKGIEFRLESVEVVLSPLALEPDAV